ncbi:MAG: TIGR00159 family protein, partial [Firmicutes bacterium]|nr:TIGR00159 family protein [Bacillota bacterium]
MWEQLRFILSQLEVGWRDIIDIGIVTFVFYRLILLLRGTRAEQLIKGLAILLLATLISGQLGIRAMNWLLIQTMTVGLIAIPIVFQPELRRALEELGRGRFFQRTSFTFDEKEFELMLDELLKAINVLVKKKFGALIVFERETGLKDIKETGIRIDGLVSAELLINIFMPHSPLHD